MKNKIISWITAVTLGLASLLPNSGNAQSIFTGLRGPTDFQLDDRVSYSSRIAQNGTETETVANNLILKYWNGKKNGVFAFVNLPYKEVETGNKKSEGLGDFAFGIGPRFEREIGGGKLGLITYLGGVLPTGDENAKPALGTGRRDYKAGLMGTFLSNSKKYEADFALDYTKTEGNGVSDEINGGVVLGGRINDNLRFVTGPMFNYKYGGKNDGDYTISGRANLRYTPSGKLGKRLHFEVWYDQFIDGDGKSCPKESRAITLVGRVNF